MGLFAAIVIYPQNIVYELAQNETVRHFLSGKWLELFVEHQVQQILNHYREEQGAEVSVCSMWFFQKRHPQGTRMSWMSFSPSMGNFSG
ncbi:MAG: hypothetical protein ACLVJH_04135 [Faecalibacterium prausnitzii]